MDIRKRDIAITDATVTPKLLLHERPIFKLIGELETTLSEVE